MLRYSLESPAPQSSEMSTLTALSQIISNGIDKIESACAAQGEAYPMLDDPYNAENDKIQNKYAVEASLIVAAAFQLIATLTNPDPYIFNGALAVSTRIFNDVLYSRPPCSRISARRWLRQVRGAFPIFSERLVQA